MEDNKVDYRLNWGGVTPVRKPTQDTKSLKSISPETMLISERPQAFVKPNLQPIAEILARPPQDGSDGYSIGIPTVKAKPVTSRQLRLEDRNREYAYLDLAFMNALDEVKKQLNVSKLTIESQIKDEATAIALLREFKKQLLKVDSIRVKDRGRAEAKKLNRSEQIMFKLILERRLGLDFNPKTVAGHNNFQYFRFTVPLVNLAKVVGKEEAGKEKLSANAA